MVSQDDPGPSAEEGPVHHPSSRHFPFHVRIDANTYRRFSGVIGVTAGESNQWREWVMIDGDGVRLDTDHGDVWLHRWGEPLPK